jgi:hypothetical protein
MLLHGKLPAAQAAARPLRRMRGGQLHAAEGVGVQGHRLLVILVGEVPQHPFHQACAAPQVRHTQLHN